MRIIMSIILLTMILSLNGCAQALMPYAENPLCSKGVAGGYCGTITDVNEVTDREMEARKQSKNIKKKEVIK